MDEVITISELVHFCALIIGVGGFYKIIMEIVKSITARHDREQKWDEAEAKLQQIIAEQSIITSCVLAILDGLEQLGANHRVTEQKTLLQQYMTDSAHKG